MKAQKKIKCRLCNKETNINGFQRHLQRTHHFNDDQIKSYYDRYILLDGKDKCIFCNKQLVFRGISHGYLTDDDKQLCKECRSYSCLTTMFWIVRYGMSEKEAQLQVSKIQNENCKKSPEKKIYWLRLGKSEKEASILAKKHSREHSHRTIEYWLKICNGDEKKAKEKLRDAQNFTSLNKFVNRYGVEDGTNRYNEFLKKVKDANSLDGLAKKYGLEQAKKIKRARSKHLQYACSKAGFQKRHGKAWKEKYDQYIENKRMSKEKFIVLYGEKEGTERWDSYALKKIENWHKTNSHTWSKISQKLFWKLYRKIKMKFEKIYFATNDNGILNEHVNKEFRIKVTTENGRKTARYLDFFVEDVCKAIEFDGSFFHKKEEDDVKRTQEILIAMPKLKILRIKDEDFERHPTIVVKECVNFLNEDNNEV